MKCKNCSEDISDDFARNVSKHVIDAMPKPQEKQPTPADKKITQYPREFQYTDFCDDCDKPHKNPSYREPTLECRNCEVELDADRESCPHCGSQDLEELDD